MEKSDVEACKYSILFFDIEQIKFNIKIIFSINGVETRQPNAKT